jgi:LmbE family N-acetylglucosaminyl deacetylase
MKTLVVAPHPDDEILGPGGTLSRRKREGNSLAWLIMTEISSDSGWSQERVTERKEEIKKITKLMEFDKTYHLGFQAKSLDRVPVDDIVSKISMIIQDFKPDEIFVPHPSDIHTDHKITYECVISASKWFRNPTVKRILAYETLSETGMDPMNVRKFSPNYYVNIERDLEKKMQAVQIYSSEIGDFPFPRSIIALDALAKIRGSEVGYKAAEAFELLKEIT